TGARIRNIRRQQETTPASVSLCSRRGRDLSGCGRFQLGWHRWSVSCSGSLDAAVASSMLLCESAPHRLADRRYHQTGPARLNANLDEPVQQIHQDGQPLVVAELNDRRDQSLERSCAKTDLLSNRKWSFGLRDGAVDFARLQCGNKCSIEDAEAITASDNAAHADCRPDGPPALQVGV